MGSVEDNIVYQQDESSITVSLYCHLDVCICCHPSWPDYRPIQRSAPLLQAHHGSLYSTNLKEIGVINLGQTGLHGYIYEGFEFKTLANQEQGTTALSR